MVTQQDNSNKLSAEIKEATFIKQELSEIEANQFKFR
jgi:hypothetical protein